MLNFHQLLSLICQLRDIRFLLFLYDFYLLQVLTKSCILGHHLLAIRLQLIVIHLQSLFLLLYLLLFLLHLHILSRKLICFHNQHLLLTIQFLVSSTQNPNLFSQQLIFSTQSLHLFSKTIQILPQTFD